MDNRVDIDVVPVNEEELSPAAFIKLVADKPYLISRTAIDLPQLGKKGFGKIRVEYSRPQYRALSLFKRVAR